MIVQQGPAEPVLGYQSDRPRNQLPQLIDVTVKKLLGRFDHEFSFPAEWEFVIVHGPNGVGKTKLLEIIAAVSRGQLERLIPMPFESVDLRYDDGSRLAVGRVGQLPIPGVINDPVERDSLKVLLTRPQFTAPISFPVEPTLSTVDASVVRFLERELPIERVSRDEWLDLDHGDRLTTRFLLERYASMLPASQRVDDGENTTPAEFQSFVKELSVHLIETQRLMTARVLRRRGRPEGSHMTVLRYSEELAGHLSRALAENSTTSQQLDRTFPRRVFQAALPDVTDDQIRKRYEDQSALRDRLSAISLLDPAEADELPLPEGSLVDWQRRMLWTYLEDTDRKLATFRPVLARVQLLQEIVNARFLFKDLVIDREKGFRFFTDEGWEIGPAALSSGEQHELVLAYELLFNVPVGSLVLIDEPEISLHVSWQQQFLNDLQRVAEVQDLRFIVATHSPQITHKWWSRAQALYREDADLLPIETRESSGS